MFVLLNVWRTVGVVRKKNSLLIKAIIRILIDLLGEFSVEHVAYSPIKA